METRGLRWLARSACRRIALCFKAPKRTFALLGGRIAIAIEQARPLLGRKLLETLAQQTSLLRIERPEGRHPLSKGLPLRRGQLAKALEALSQSTLLSVRQ